MMCIPASGRSAKQIAAMAGCQIHFNACYFFLHRIVHNYLSDRSQIISGLREMVDKLKKSEEETSDGTSPVKKKRTTKSVEPLAVSIT